MKSIYAQVIGTLLLVSFMSQGYSAPQRGRYRNRPGFGQQQQPGPAPGGITGPSGTPGLEYTRNPDGSISGSYSASQAINQPGATGAFGVSQTFSFGPKGSSFGGSQTASLNGNYPGGNNFGFSQSNTLANSQGPNGFSSSGSNSAANNFQNPLFSSSNANANAFANSNQFRNPSFQNQFGGRK